MNATLPQAPKQPRKPRPSPAPPHPRPGTAFQGHRWLGRHRNPVAKQTDRYLLHTIPSDFGNGAIGFEVEKLDADLNPVEVSRTHLSNRPEDRTCDCKGCLRHGHCKHLEGIEALRKAGRLLTLNFRSAGDTDYTPPPAQDFYPDEPPQLEEAAYYEPDDAA